MQRSNFDVLKFEPISQGRHNYSIDLEICFFTSTRQLLLISKLLNY